MGPHHILNASNFPLKGSGASAGLPSLPKEVLRAA
jgi:hypothetical protein